MLPRYKIGFLAGLAGLVINVCMTSIVGLCGPLTAVAIGALAGFFTARQEKQAIKNDGAMAGAIAGSIAGLFVLIGQMIGGLVALFLLQYTRTQIIFGTIPDPSADLPQQIVYYASGLGTGLCFGLVDIAVAALAGAAAGYVGSPNPAPMAPLPPAES